MAYLKIAATSMGTVVLLALLLKPCVSSSFPVVSRLLPAVSWLEPPYIYVLINVIVLAIAASSKFHRNPSEKPPHMIIFPSSASEELHVAGGELDFDHELKEEIIAEDSSKVMIMEVVDGEVDKFIISPPEIVASPDEDDEVAGDPALMSPLEQHGTFEDTWKAITEGRQQQQPKEKDTWRDYDRQMQLQESELHAQKMVKLETFRDRRSTNYTARTEPSLSQDELNRRVEAFIRKFNEEMRLQREESLNQYKEVISRGA